MSLKKLDSDKKAGKEHFTKQQQPERRCNQVIWQQVRNMTAFEKSFSEDEMGRGSPISRKLPAICALH